MCVCIRMYVCMYMYIDIYIHTYAQLGRLFGYCLHRRALQWNIVCLSTLLAVIAAASTMRSAAKCVGAMQFRTPPRHPGLLTSVANAAPGIGPFGLTDMANRGAAIVLVIWRNVKWDLAQCESPPTFGL